MMGSALEDIRILQEAEKIADDVWKVTLRWDDYVKRVMGQQLCRAVDSIGANIAEAFGRYHYGEKIRFLYYARGSLFETKYWINRAHARNLIPSEQASTYANHLNNLGRQLNGFVKQTRALQRKNDQPPKRLRETAPNYHITADQEDDEFLSPEEQEWLSNP